MGWSTTYPGGHLADSHLAFSFAILKYLIWIYLFCPKITSLWIHFRDLYLIKSLCVGNALEFKKDFWLFVKVFCFNRATLFILVWKIQTKVLSPSRLPKPRRSSQKHCAVASAATEYTYVHQAHTYRHLKELLQRSWLNRATVNHIRSSSAKRSVTYLFTYIWSWDSAVFTIDGICTYA